MKCCCGASKEVGIHGETACRWSEEMGKEPIAWSNAKDKRIAELEVELAGHKARLAAINIYGDADIAAFKWQARAEKAEAEVERLKLSCAQDNHACYCVVASGRGVNP